MLSKVKVHEMMKKTLPTSFKEISSSRTNIYLKAKSINLDTSSDDEDKDTKPNISLFVKRFNHLVKKSRFDRSNTKRTLFGNGKGNQDSKKKFYECGKQGHFINKCPMRKSKDDKEKRPKKDKYNKYKGDYKKKSYKGRKNVYQWDSKSNSDSNSNTSSYPDTSSPQGHTTIIIGTTPIVSLFGEESDEDKPHTCLMERLEE